MILALTDATIQDVLLGIIGNGLWSLIAQSGTKAVREIRTLVSPPQSSVVKAIREASEHLADSVHDPAGDGPDRLICYLKSPELECIVRQLFATTLVGPHEGATIENVRGEFLCSMSKHLDINKERLQPFATSFLDGLLSGVEDSLTAAIEKNVLSAHEAKSSSRHRVMLDELANFKKNIAFLGTGRPLDLVSILQFEAKYREQVGCVPLLSKLAD